MINAAEIVYYVIHMENDTFCMNVSITLFNKLNTLFFQNYKKKRHIFLNNLLFFAIIVKIYGNMITVTIGKTYGVF